MILASLGQAEDMDTQRAVERAINQCRQQLQGKKPQAGIVFAGINFDHRLMLDNIHRSFQNIELIGCTTAGEFSSNYGFSDDSIALMVFHSDTIQIKAGVGRCLSQNPEEAVKSAVSQAKEGLTKPASICLAFPDGQYGLEKSFEPVMKMLGRKLGRECPVFGGVAGTQWKESPTILQFS